VRSTPTSIELMNLYDNDDDERLCQNSKGNCGQRMVNWGEGGGVDALN